MMVLGGVVMGSQSVFASATAGNLYMGFQNSAGGGKADYIINLGSASTLTANNAVVDLSADFSFSDFTSTGSSGLEGNNAADIQGGVVGGLGSGQTAGVYVTELRKGGAGAPAVAGSKAPAATPKSADVPAWTDINDLVTPGTVGTGLLDTSKSWESLIEPTFNSGTFWGLIGVNPDTTVTTNSVLYEDLWFSQSSGPQEPYVYQGYFTLTVGSSSASLTYTPSTASVPLTSPQIQSIQWAPNAATVIWTTVASHTYQLQSATDLTLSNWVNVGSSQLAGSSTLTNTDSSAVQSYKFYRVTGQ